MRKKLDGTLFMLATILWLLCSAVSAQVTPAKANTPVSDIRNGARQTTGPASKFVTVYGAKIHYMEAGSGPVVIFLHGLGGDRKNWGPTIGPLSEKYRVIAPDQIGFGLSDKPLINYRIGTLVDVLDRMLKELKIERASLVGNSLGGWAAAAFTLAHPEKVDRLVLVDAAGFALSPRKT